MKVLIVTDHVMFGESWGEYLVAKNKLVSQVLTCTVATAGQTAARENADYILCDLSSKIAAFQLITELQRSGKDARIVLLMSGNDMSEILPLLKSNTVCGILTRQSGIDELVRCFRRSRKGQVYIGKDIEAAPLEDSPGPDRRVPNIFLLSGRELQIAKLTVAGLTGKEIAEIAGLSFKTVEVHRHHIFKKLKIKNSISLVNMFTNKEYQGC